MKAIVLFLMISFSAFANEEWDLWLHGALRRMAVLAHVELGALEDVVYQTPERMHFVYGLMGQLYDSGQEDRIRLADAIYKSGVELDSVLIEQVGYRWDDSMRLSFGDKVVLKAREISGGYIIGLYGNNNQIYEAMDSDIEEIRRAAEHRDVYMQMWSEFLNDTPRNFIIQNVWRRSIETARNARSRGFSEPVFLESHVAVALVPMIPSAPPQSNRVTPQLSRRSLERQRTPLSSRNATPRYLPPAPRLHPRTPPSARTLRRNLFEDADVLPVMDQFLDHGERESFNEFANREVKDKPPEARGSQADRLDTNVARELDNVDRSVGRVISNVGHTIQKIVRFRW